MVNRFLEWGIDQTIQTNGTTPRRLDELTSFDRLDFQVSIDGYRDFHEWHRGEGTYDRSLDFCRKAVDKGCRSMLIRCLLTRGNIDHLDEFHADLVGRIGPKVKLEICAVYYTNQNLPSARNMSPAIRADDIDDSSCISYEEARQIVQKKYQGRYEVEDPDGDKVENYLSLTPYGVYTCCDSMVRIGDADSDMRTLIQRLYDSEVQCRACNLFPCQ
jgi:sulfatase maturation enzyme AslB (radical SAM superfamily)